MPGPDEWGLIGVRVLPGAGFDDVPDKAEAVFQVGDAGVFFIGVGIVVAAGYVRAAHVQTAVLEGHNVRRESLSDRIAKTFGGYVADKSVGA